MTNPEVLRLAREIAKVGCYETDDGVVGIIIAAIERTTELAKAANTDVILKARIGEIDNDLRCVGHHLESTLERYDHLRQSEKDNSDAS